ncbi:MAG: histidine phosphatase family protein [Candidatus Lokiarchaeota archaeon]|nr:histidine phosphatase family protein [Candidatus Lokiarchaeota archaeon]
MMDSKEIWNNASWALNARKLINIIEEFPKEANLILLIRHSQRGDTRDIKKMIKMRLTPNGIEIANRFGNALPINRFIRLYHSISPRCKETVEAIVNGYKEKSNNFEIMGTFKPLYDIGASGEFIISETFNSSIIHFLKKWVAGYYSSEQIQSFEKYCKEAAKTIWNATNNTDQKRIDIHITHDILLLALRMGWFGIPPEKDWPLFLNGFIFTIYKNKIWLYISDEIQNLDIPYWWTNSK